MTASPYKEIQRMSPVPRQDVFRILVIDDHEDTISLIQTFLERTSRYQVIPALTGAEGLQLMESESPDLILLDAWLPDINGVELCRQIRESRPATPILFYSAAAYRSDIEIGLAAGAHAYLVKPADLDVLELTIQRLIKDTPTTAAS
jgi:DNA-binding response OmpR family regulator